MTKKTEKKFVWDERDKITDIANVQAIDKVMQVGGKPMSFLKKYVREDVTYVPKLADLRSEFIRHRYFDKIFVLDSDFTEFLGAFDQLVNMNVGGFVVGLFNKRELESDALADLCEEVETWWYPAEIWAFESNDQCCVMTNARGTPTFTADPDIGLSCG